jgi:hypothetical protein
LVGISDLIGAVVQVAQILLGVDACSVLQNSVCRNVGNGVIIILWNGMTEVRRAIRVCWETGFGERASTLVSDRTRSVQRPT